MQKDLVGVRAWRYRARRGRIAAARKRWGSQGATGQQAHRGGEGELVLWWSTGNGAAPSCSDWKGGAGGGEAERRGGVLSAAVGERATSHGTSAGGDVQAARCARSLARGRDGAGGGGVSSCGTLPGAPALPAERCALGVCQGCSLYRR